MTLREHTIDMEGFTLSVRETGSGPPVALAHSLTFDHTMWLGLVRALSADYRVLLVDLHGHGSSRSPDRVYTLEDMADDMARVLDHLDVERVAWVGHSMGGMIGLRLALQHPDRVGALALCNTSARAEVESARDMFHHINEASRGKTPNEQTVNFIIQLMFSEGYRTEHPDVVKIYADLLYKAPDPEGAYRTGHAVIWRTDVTDRLSEITAPTLVVASKDDTAVPVFFGEAMAKAIPGATLTRLEGGHLSPVEQAQPFGEALRAFLDTCNWGAK